MTTNRKAVRLVVGVHVGIAAVEVEVLTVIVGIITTPVEDVRTSVEVGLSFSPLVFRHARIKKSLLKTSEELLSGQVPPEPFISAF